MISDNKQLGDFDFVDSRLKRIGMIVPSSNTNAEPDCQMLAPSGVTIHVTRSGGYDVSAIPDSAEMQRFARQSLEQQIPLLVDSRVDMIAYACTSATLSEGPEFDRQFCSEITQRSGLNAVTTAGALVQAIQQLKLKRVAFTSPYVKDLADEAVDFIRQADIDVVNQLEFDRELSSLEQNALTPRDAYKMALRCDHPEAEAIIISCTDYRALEALPAIEKTLAKPVISSNQALMYASLKLIAVNIGSDLPGGRLFGQINY